MFKKFQSIRNKKRFEIERALLSRAIRRAVQLAQPDSKGLSRIPDDHLLLNGTLLICNLVRDPTLAKEAFDLPKDSRECSRMCTYVVGTIALRGMVDFGGYHEDEELKNMVASNFVQLIFPELEEGFNNERLVTATESAIQMYWNKVDTKDLIYRKAPVQFLLNQNEDSYFGLIRVKHAVIDIFEKPNAT